MTATIPSSSRCRANQPYKCRYHGSRFAGFQESLVARYRSLQQRLETATDVRARYLIEQELKEAEIDWASTDEGQAELQDRISAGSADDMETERLQDLLKSGARLRERLEKRTDGVVEFPASKLGEAIHRVEKANRRLERANIPDRFEYTIEEYVTSDGEGGHIAMVRMELQRPLLEIEGWRFVAALDPDGNGGLITRPYPGVELEGYRPKEFRCDQCNSNRRRKATYLVRNSEGEYKQVGSNCLHDFLGMKPEGMWALEWDLEDRNQFLDRGARGTIHAMDDYRAPLQEVVATALAVVEQEGRYIPQSRVPEGRTSTRSLVWNSFFNRRHPVDHTPYMKKAEEVIRTTRFEGNDDYATNMRQLMSSEWVGVKHLGYAVSVVGAYNRQNAVHTPRQHAVGYVAEIGEKITGLKATVKKVFHTVNTYNGVERDVTMLVFTDEQGREVKWNASGSHHYRVGEKVLIETAKVKDHSTYRDDQQTIVTRAKVSSLETSDED